MLLTRLFKSTMTFLSSWFTTSRVGMGTRSNVTFTNTSTWLPTTDWSFRFPFKNRRSSSSVSIDPRLISHSSFSRLVGPCCLDDGNSNRCIDGSISTEAWLNMVEFTKSITFSGEKIAFSSASRYASSASCSLTIDSSVRSPSVSYTWSKKYGNSTLRPSSECVMSMGMSKFTASTSMSANVEPSSVAANSSVVIDTILAVVVALVTVVLLGRRRRQLRFCYASHLESSSGNKGS